MYIYDYFSIMTWRACH